MAQAGHISPEVIAAVAAEAAFGRPLMTNVHRGLIAEAIVDRALSEPWRWCAADYSAWDFERADGIKLEVRQSASRQSWHSEFDPPSRVRFDIRARTGRFEGKQWIAERRRWAHVYIFAHHHVVDVGADHRDIDQWHFYVVSERVLPDRASITLARLKNLATAVRFYELSDVVNQIADAAY